VDKSANRTETQRYLKSVFNENPYDIETFFEGLEIMADNGKELFFVDRVLSRIRKDPTIDLATATFEVLRDYETVKLVFK
jgi:hypothetical protein